MKTRRSTLELTPLLDVVLIILFVFMLMLANQVNESTKVKNDAQEQIENMQEQLDESIANNISAEQKIMKLEEDNRELLKISTSTEAELINQRNLSNEQQETTENLAKAVAEFIKDESQEIKDYLEEKDNATPSEAQEMIEEITSTQDIAEQLLKYEAISRQFYFIDIELKTKNGRLYINDESTTLGIASDEINDDDARQDKVDEVKKLIEEDMEKRQGGSQMVFVTLKVHDRYVYQNAWEVVWDAIGEIQEKYGTDKIFRTHITLIKN